MNTNFEKEKLIALVVHFFNGNREILYDLRTHEALLAGGTINSIFSNRDVNDLDFYCRSEEQCNALIESVRSKGFEISYVSDNAVTLIFKRKKVRYIIQVIKRFVGEPKFILDTFDFTIVQGLYDFKTGEFVFGDSFLKHIAQKKLVYTSTSKYPICALYRTKKYQERGYTLSGASIVALSLSINSLKLETYADLKDQLMGIDTYMMKQIESSWGDINKPFELSIFLQEWYSLAYGEDLNF